MTYGNDCERYTVRSILNFLDSLLPVTYDMYSLKLTTYLPA